jgi:branched-chain amino acid transport system ATP-binding protein
VAARPAAGGWTEERVFALFPRLAARREAAGDKLSGGEQQMLAIGRALMTNPELLLMDEPTEGLAPLVVREVAGVIAGLRREGLSILLVEQSLPFATRLADRVHVLDRGRIVHTSAPAELLANEEVKSRFLGLQT